ncbi:uncharacterized protein LOC107730947 [Sinocyclocheilus rhinocerous]|uniref:uncharacterized protein LOC107730947 n=1 Tax=Sinocyclocheilus rhinocerous TaxID=307959 RepID=UPI0007B866AC|nr:PREDICTED: uncharacterized protein LOC107730947 [Sinocyclocheilus rhinocerous]
MSETLQLPALQIQGPVDGECNGCEVDLALSSSSSPSLRRKRFKMCRMKNVMSEKEQLQRSGSKEYLQLPSIEITPSSDEDAAWSSCSTPSTSPQRRRFLLRKWLRGGEKKEHGSESSSQQSSLQSSHEEESTRYLSPNTRDDRYTLWAALHVIFIVCRFYMLKYLELRHLSHSSNIYALCRSHRSFLMCPTGVNGWSAHNLAEPNSSQQSSLQSSHEEESTRYLSPNTRDDSSASVVWF